MGVCAFSNLAPVGPVCHQNVRSMRAGILFIHCFFPGTWTTEHLTHAGRSVNVCGMNEATWKHVALRGGGGVLFLSSPLEDRKTHTVLLSTADISRDRGKTYTSFKKWEREKSPLCMAYNLLSGSTGFALESLLS